METKYVDMYVHKLTKCSRRIVRIAYVNARVKEEKSLGAISDEILEPIL
jgi:hypothetical protein